MNRTILALLAAASLSFGVCAAAHIPHASAMAQQPQETWVQAPTPVVHKRHQKAHTAHKQAIAPTPQARPLEPLPPVMAPEAPAAPKATPAPPPAAVKPSYLERNHRELWWLDRILGSLLIGGALGLIYFAGTKVYAGYQATKGTKTA